jgi:hypothetical protein
MLQGNLINLSSTVTWFELEERQEFPDFLELMHLLRSSTCRMATLAAPGALLWQVACRGAMVLRVLSLRHWKVVEEAAKRVGRALETNSHLERLDLGRSCDIVELG